MALKASCITFHLSLTVLAHSTHHRIGSNMLSRQLSRQTALDDAEAVACLNLCGLDESLLYNSATQTRPALYVSWTRSMFGQPRPSVIKHPSLAPH